MAQRYRDPHGLQEITTPRLILRPVEWGDVAGLWQAIQRSRQSLQRWMPWAHDLSIAATEDFVASEVRSWRDLSSRVFSMTVLQASDRRILGVSGFNGQSVPQEGFYEIGYWIDTDYSGQGFVTEWVIALTRYAFEALSARCVQIGMQADNTQSQAVARRCGFQLEAVSIGDRRDCLSHQKVNSEVWMCFDPAALPPLAVAWRHAD